MEKPSRAYGLLTVRLENPPATLEEAYPRIKAALGITHPVIDDKLGAAPQPVAYNKPAGEEWYVVGVDLKHLWKLAESGNPAVVGCMNAMAYTEGHSPLGLKNPPAPPKTNGGPRRNGPKP